MKVLSQLQSRKYTSCVPHQEKYRELCYVSREILGFFAPCVVMIPWTLANIRSDVLEHRNSEKS